ncbi:hypothetical protein Mgra_00009486 [Meloidogyne graminicola]|uniref:Uncharacterized protein n=1 Tax=Meloidogyne graminicola TaxID=189291 RepID=A0A8S9ZDB3_9BILA|nr:hypothetical protein Mgra_00009486 [Meloidogyne graminicola]
MQRATVDDDRCAGELETRLRKRNLFYMKQSESDMRSFCCLLLFQFIAAYFSGSTQRKVMENRSLQDEERANAIEEQQEAQSLAEEADHAS